MWWLVQMTLVSISNKPDTYQWVQSSAAAHRSNRSFLVHYTCRHQLSSNMKRKHYHCQNMSIVSKKSMHERIDTTNICQISGNINVYSTPTFLINVIWYDNITYSITNENYGGIRNAPSNRITSPLRYVFSTICCTNAPNSSGLPSLETCWQLTNKVHLPTRIRYKLCKKCANFWW